MIPQMRDLALSPRQLVGGDVTDAGHVPRHFRERAHHEDQHAPPVVLLERGGHGPVGARWVADELVDPRRALEVVPRDLRLPCRDRRLVLVIVGVGGLGLALAQRLLEAHALYALTGLARPLQVEGEVGNDFV